MVFGDFNLLNEIDSDPYLSLPFGCYNRKVRLLVLIGRQCYRWPLVISYNVLSNVWDKHEGKVRNFEIDAELYRIRIT